VKLVIAIVRDDYSEVLQDELADAGHRYTKLASTGGFLRKGNTTLLVGVDDDQMDFGAGDNTCYMQDQAGVDHNAADAYVPGPCRSSH